MRLFLLAAVAVMSTLFAVPTARAEVVVSAAISLKSVLEAAQPELEKVAGEKVTFNFGASGTLAGQIVQGAPVDLFISADRATVERLLSAHAAAAESVKVIAGNVLVLVAPKRSAAPAKVADLPEVKRVAVGEPKVVPAGVYAKEALVALKLWEPLEKAGKLVTCENVAQVVTLVDRGEVEAGFVYRTDALAAKNVRVVAEVDPALHGKIEYVSAVVTASKKAEAVGKVQAALLGERVRGILKDKGFAVGEGGVEASRR
jgi:molybdate transport system substrate-binding protein